MRHLNEPQLTIVRNVKSIEKLLKKTKERNLNVVAWKLIGDKKVSTPIEIRILRKFRNEIVIENTDKNNHDAFASLISSSDIINLYIPDEIILFQVKIKSRSYDKEVVLSYPQEVVLLTKRKDLRSIVDLKNPISVEFLKKKLNQSSDKNGVYFKKDFNDIGPGGASLYLNKTEAGAIDINDKLWDMKFKINGHNIHCDALVKSVQLLGPEDDNELVYKAYKIGLKFVFRKENDKYILEEFIHSNMPANQIITR